MNKIYKLIKKIYKLNEDIVMLDYAVNVCDDFDQSNELNGAEAKHRKLTKKLNKACKEYLNAKSKCTL